MKILVYANEAVGGQMTVGEFIDSVKRIYNQYFPGSECIAQNRKIFGQEYIQIIWYLSKDSSETAHNIRDNDMLHIAFDIDLEDNTKSGEVYEVTIYDNSSKNDRPMPDTITLNVQHKSYLTVPENSYYAYGRRSLPFRKTTGDAKKIISAFDRFVDKLYTITRQQYESGNLTEYWTKIVEDGNKL